MTLPGIVRALRSAVHRWDASLPFARYVVEGPSMEPAYRAGERLLVNRRAYRRSAPAPGDVIVLRDPEERSRYLLKRVATAPDSIEPGRLGVYVLGDNAGASRDSRHFGPVARSQIVGRVWLRY